MWRMMICLQAVSLPRLVHLELANTFACLQTNIIIQCISCYVTSVEASAKVV